MLANDFKWPWLMMASDGLMVNHDGFMMVNYWLILVHNVSILIVNHGHRSSSQWLIMMIDGCLIMVNSD